MRALGSCLAVLTLSLGTACGSKGAVSLGARLENPDLSARSAALGVQLNGGFDLILELGSAAPGGTNVELGTFAIKGPSATLVDALSLRSDADFPVQLDAGQSKTVRLTLDGSELVEANVQVALCGADVWFTGVVTDSLSNGQTTLATSNKFKPACE